MPDIEVGSLVHIENTETGQKSWQPPRRVDMIEPHRHSYEKYRVGGRWYMSDIGVGMEWVVTAPEPEVL